MVLQDYRFVVLNNVFTNHLELQQGKNYSTNRQNQITANLARYKVFFREMKSKYGKDPFNKCSLLKAAWANYTNEAMAVKNSHSSKDDLKKKRK